SPYRVLETASVPLMSGAVMSCSVIFARRILFDGLTASVALALSIAWRRDIFSPALPPVTGEVRPGRDRRAKSDCQQSLRVQSNMMRERSESACKTGQELFIGGKPELPATNAWIRALQATAP